MSSGIETLLVFRCTSYDRIPPVWKRLGRNGYGWSQVRENTLSSGAAKVSRMSVCFATGTNANA
jgi:hypothetical protein